MQMVHFIAPFLALLMITATASAEMYRYIDKNGVERFTNDLSQVPEQFQSTVETFTEIKGTPVDTRSPVPTTNTQPPPKKPAVTGNPSVSSSPSTDYLRKEKKRLEKEYQDLLKEKEPLGREINQYEKRYKTRRRKPATRKKLKDLKIIERELDKKIEKNIHDRQNIEKQLKTTGQ
jgi:hypothetical protein